MGTGHSILTKDIAALEFLKESDVFDLENLGRLEISQKLQNELKEKISTTEKEFGQYIDKKLQNLSKEKNDVSKALKSVTNKLKTIEKKFKEAKSLKIITEKYADKEKVIAKINDLKVKIDNLKNKIEKIKNEIFSLFDKRNDLISKLIKDLKNSFNKIKFQFIKIKFSSICDYNQISHYCLGSQNSTGVINTHNNCKYKNKHKKNVDTNKKSSAYKFLYESGDINENNANEISKELFTELFEDNILLTSNSNKQEVMIRLLSNWFDIDYDNSIYSEDDNIAFWEMSDGQKVNALLELTFKLENSLFPILIDQPEDELDSRAIADTVTKFFLNQKKHKQIIIVSHNANLVVLADTENVIVTDKHGSGDNISFAYRNGAMEEVTIKEKIIRILEGGGDAFIKRGEKLNLISKR